MVGANLNIMQNDTNLMRKGKPWFFTNLSSGKGVEDVLKYLKAQIPNIKSKVKNFQYCTEFNKMLPTLQN